MKKNMLPARPQSISSYLRFKPDVDLRQPADVEMLKLDGGRTLLVHHKGDAGAPPRGREPVLVLHGIESHPLWFVGSCDYLARQGHEVYQLQRRGSGLRIVHGGAKADRGHADSPQQLLEDVHTAVEYVLRQTGAEKLYLLGISWGGKLAACYALDPARAQRLAGLVLVAPGIRPHVDLPWRQKLLVAVCAAVRPRHTFALPLEEPSLFTDNPAWQAYIRDDPYRLHRVTASFLLTSWLLDRRISAAARGSLKLPVKLILAGEDRIIDNIRTRRSLEKLAAGNLGVQELPGAHAGV